MEWNIRMASHFIADCFPSVFYVCTSVRRTNAQEEKGRARKNVDPARETEKSLPFFSPFLARPLVHFASGPSFWRVLRACSCWCIKVFYDRLFVTSTTKLNSINKNTHIYIKIKLELLKPLKFSDWRSSNDHKICQTMLKTKALKPVFRRCNLHNFRIGWWHNLPNWMFSFN